MNQSTQRKIAEAIEKLGEIASYRKIAAEAKTSLRSVTTYMHEKGQSGNNRVVTEQVVTPKVVTPKIVQSKPAVATRPEIGEAIRAAKECIGWPESGVFPTTARLVAETGYTAQEIDTYFEERLQDRQGKQSTPLLRGMQYTGPLPTRPYYGPIQINMTGDWRPRGVGETRVGSF